MGYFASVLSSEICGAVGLLYCIVCLGLLNVVCNPCQVFDFENIQRPDWVKSLRVSSRRSQWQREAPTDHGGPEPVDSCGDPILIPTSTRCHNCEMKCLEFILDSGENLNIT